MALRRAQQRVEVDQRAGERTWELRGNNLAIQSLRDKEIMLVGPAGTGKTLGVLVYIDRLMREYPGARSLIVRKVRADLAQSVLVTYERDVLGYDNPICAGVQRESRHSYKYPNGSEVVVGGMDRPGKILSSEYDLIYPPEAVQHTEEDWEYFLMRNRNWVIPWQQVIGDTNPDRPDHWIVKRADAGRLKLLNTYHRDNPAYWDLETNDWTARGREYVLGTLAKNLSGVRRARFFEGKWVLAEGAVYDEWNEALHVVDTFEIPPSWRRIRAIDFGYTNPFVCQWWAIDPDGRMYLYREIYRTQQIVEDHARTIKALTGSERIEATVADHDAEDRATLAKYGITTLRAQKEISVGIQAVQGRLRPAGDGKPRLYVLKGARVEPDTALVEAKKPTSTQEEFPGYLWPKGVDGKAVKEVPVDVDNHGMDCVRYAVRYIDRPKARSRANPIYGG